jgi:hypothetical protein
MYCSKAIVHPWLAPYSARLESAAVRLAQPPVQLIALRLFRLAGSRGRELRRALSGIVDRRNPKRILTGNSSEPSTNLCPCSCPFGLEMLASGDR